MSKVRQVEFEPGRYMVASETSDNEYLVDLTEKGGWCGCRGWEVRKTCHHIALAKMFAVLETAIVTLENESEPSCQCRHCKVCRELSMKIKERVE